MDIQWTDFNLADEFFETVFPDEWEEVYDVLMSMPTYLKASDQKNFQGNPIFDAIGTNNYIKESLATRSWATNHPIPIKFSFLGTNIDFFKNSTLVEAQFSNYPFLLNNLIRSELFYKSRTTFGEEYPKALIIITKGRIFPASNSTLYYEQAVSQVNALTKYNVFGIPIRIVGLFLPDDEEFTAVWTTYHNSRYSRTIVSQVARNARVIRKKGGNARYFIQFIDT